MGDDRVKIKATVYGNTVKELKRHITDLKEDSINQVGTIEKLRAGIEDQRAELEQYRADEIIRLHEAMSAPINACADEKAPSPLPPIYRVVTNGEMFRPQQSKDGGESWRNFWDPNKGDNLSFRSYKKAEKELLKNFGTKAIILEREWRAV